MKILNINSNPIKTNISSPNFKSKNITTYIKKELLSTTKNPATKDLFIQLSGVLGLTSIISWVNSLNNTKDKENIDKLDYINTTWTQKVSEKLIDPETSGAFLDLVSKADTNESILWTEALLAKDDNNEEIKTPIIEENVKNIFLNKDSNETFMGISANKKLSNLLNQIKYISQAEESIQSKFLENAKKQLSSLIKKANELANNEETASLYEKINNIVKSFTLLSIFENNKPCDSTVPNEIPTQIEAPKTEPDIKEESDDTSPTVHSSLKVVGKIDIKPESTKRFKSSNVSETALEKQSHVDKEIVITDKNKEFVEIFKKAFKKSSLVTPEAYADKIDYIMSIYNNYEKESLKKAFLKSLSTENIIKTVERYEKLTGGKASAIDFIVFIHMDKLKHKNASDFTQEEFDRICSYKDTQLKYFTVQDVPEEITLTFIPDVTAEERFKIIADFHKTFFNIPDSRLFLPQEDKNISQNDIIKELSEKLIKNPDDYENILKFLGVDTTLINHEISKGNKEGVIDTFEILFSEKEAKYRAQYLVNILNNKAFDNLFGSVHGKMRFIERYVLNNPKNINKSDYEIKQITSREILKLKTTIEKTKDIIVYNYKTSLADTKNNKCSASCVTKDYTIALNKDAQIHTLFNKNNSQEILYT